MPKKNLETLFDIPLRLILRSATRAVELDFPPEMLSVELCMSRMSSACGPLED